MFVYAHHLDTPPNIDRLVWPRLSEYSRYFARGGSGPSTIIDPRFAYKYASLPVVYAAIFSFEFIDKLFSYRCI